jgi:hypothetical protein
VTEESSRGIGELNSYSGWKFNLVAIAGVEEGKQREGEHGRYFGI